MSLLLIESFHNSIFIRLKQSQHTVFGAILCPLVYAQAHVTKGLFCYITICLIQRLSQKSAGA